MSIISGILIIAGLILAIVLIKRFFRKVSDKLDRIFNPIDAKREDDLLQTVVIFTTSAPLAQVRQKVIDCTTDTEEESKVSVIVEKEEYIVWGGMTGVGIVPGMGGILGEGDSFKAYLSYTEKDGLTKCVFSIPISSKTEGIASHVNDMMSLRNSVVMAILGLDPNANIETAKQDVKYKIPWF